MKQKINIGLIGFGTVGTGVYKILDMLRTQIYEKVGAEIVIKRIVSKEIKNDPDIKLDKKIVSKDVNDILNDETIDIVVELIGGYEPAHTFMLEALNKKKHVVTANKAVLAKYWDQMHSVAKKNEALIYFEASVGAGIPIIQSLNEGLCANRIDSIYGILNGTTNYILTRMVNDQMPFENALKLAQEKGFAESDPSFDIKGIDTAHKLAILSSIATNSSLHISDVYCEGIDAVDLKDVLFAEKEFGLIMKLLAIMKQKEGMIEMRVHPTFVPKNHLLSSVNDEFNAMYVEGNTAGNIMLYGKGAGQLPAASGVVSDIVYIARQIVNGTAGKNPFVNISKQSKKMKLRKMEDIESKYYLRFSAKDKPGVLSKITGILGKNNVSIASCFQKEITDAFLPVVIITHTAKEKNILKALKQIDTQPFIKPKSIMIRIEDEI